MLLALWIVSIFCIDSACQEALGNTGLYLRKPDCFRRAAGRIRVKCAEIDLDADQRVKGMCALYAYMQLIMDPAYSRDRHDTV
jgi:hypothetical protein